jgi:hypothetical protein
MVCVRVIVPAAALAHLTWAVELALALQQCWHNLPELGHVVGGAVKGGKGWHIEAAAAVDVPALEVC